MRYLFSYIAIIGSTLALPLNINLGAYSPALVVGDGEISFGAGGNGETSARSASQVLETLASGAAASAQANGQAGATPAAGGEGATNATSATDATGATGAEGATSAGGETTTTDPAAATAPSATPAASGEPQARAQIMKKVLQGPFNKRDDITISERDIQGFRESLNFAKEAMKNTPEIDIGTEKAGVGILQSPGLNVPGNTPAAGIPTGTGNGNGGGATAPAAAAPPAAGKRELEPREEKLGITLLAIREI